MPRVQTRQKPRAKTKTATNKKTGQPPTIRKQLTRTGRYFHCTVETRRITSPLPPEDGCYYAFGIMVSYFTLPSAISVIRSRCPTSET